MRKIQLNSRARGHAPKHRHAPLIRQIREQVTQEAQFLTARIFFLIALFFLFFFFF